MENSNIFNIIADQQISSNARREGKNVTIIFKIERIAHKLQRPSFSKITITVLPRGLVQSYSRLVVASAAVALVANTVLAEEWPQFLGPTRNGVYDGLEVADAWPEQRSLLVWQKKVGQGFSGPVVAQNRLILFHRLGDRETVECLDANNGQQLWSFDYSTGYRDNFGFDEGPRSTPSISEGRVYTFGAEGVLHCLDLETGEKIWRVDPHRKFGVQKGFFGAACSPLVEGNQVLLNIGGKEGAGLVAFDRSTGKTLWTATNDEASYSSPIAASMGGTRHAFFFTRNGLVAADPATGKVRFQFRWRSRSQSSVNAATPLVVDDLIFLSASYRTGAVLLQLAGNNVKELWSSDDVLSNHYATSVYSEGYLYGFHGRQEYGPSIRCVELKTGQVQWTVDRFGAGTVTLAGKHLLILRENGELILASATPKEFRTTARAQALPATVRSYPALANGRLYARNETTLVCISLRK